MDKTGQSRLARQIVFGAAAVAAACVSLTPPPRGGGNIPVLRGVYRPGAEQQVRILLVTTDSSPRLGATGPWVLLSPGTDTTLGRFEAGEAQAASQALARSTTSVIARPLSADSYVTWAGKRYRGEIVLSAGDTGVLVVNRLSMDSYLRGVVPLEIGNRTAAEFAAVQAQAVAARTYAYKHLNASRAFDMYSTVQDQVYGGVDAEKPQSDSAIATTADLIVLYKGQPISTPYHSTCGGSTAGVTEVWYNQQDEPYLRPVSDRIPGSEHFYCDPSPRFSWVQNYDGSELRAVMEKYLAS